MKNQAIYKISQSLKTDGLLYQASISQTNIRQCSALFLIFFRVDFDLLSSSLVDASPAITEQLDKLKTFASTLNESVVNI